MLGGVEVLEARVLWNVTNIPVGCGAVDACANVPTEIKGVTVRRRARCAFVEGSPDPWILDNRLGPDGLRVGYRDFWDVVSPISPHLYVAVELTHLRDGKL